jgi:hypothetical protein
VGRILIVGGYGAFGARAAERLAREPGLDVIVAGRSREKADALARRLSAGAAASVGAAAIDATAITAVELARLAPDVIINASGPFQAQDYGLARAAIEAQCHYVDLADAHAFVTGIGALDDAARAANVCVISGASSVPGLSSAVVQAFADRFDELSAVEIAISPGNSFDPGVATVASILGHAGKAHRELRDGAPVTVYGWQRLQRAMFPGVGKRWLGSVDVPDLTLLPQHYPALRNARFAAGLEVGAFHLGVWGLSWLVRAGAIDDLGALSRSLLAAKRALRFLGSDRGGMLVRLRGRDGNGARKTMRWSLTAGSGHGPYVPAIASVVLAKALAAGKGPARGARPCFGLFTLADFEGAVADLDITCAADAGV